MQAGTGRECPLLPTDGNRTTWHSVGGERDLTMKHGGDWAGYQEEYGCLPMDFSASVSPFGLPKEVREAAVCALDETGCYPDPFCRELRRKLM